MHPNIEQMVREAFPAPARHIPKPTPPPKLVVTMNVQHWWGGHRFHVRYVIDTISRFEAELQAEKLARRDRYKVWWVYDIEEYQHV